MAIFGADADVAARGGVQGGLQVYKRHACNNVALRVLYQGLNGLQQFPGLAGRLVHLPVSRNNSFSQSFVHGFGFLSFS